MIQIVQSLLYDNDLVGLQCSGWTSSHPDPTKKRAGLGSSNIMNLQKSPSLFINSKKNAT